MTGNLSRGDFVKLIYRLGRATATGELRVIERTPRSLEHNLYLRRGYLTAARVEGHWAPLGELLLESGVIDADMLRRSLEAVASGSSLQGRALCAEGAISDKALDGALKRQAELRLERLAAVTDAVFAFDPRAPAPPAHRSGRPFEVQSWARRHIEARVDAARAQSFAAEIAGQRLALRKDMVPAELDDTDRRVINALAAPRRLDEIARAAAAPRLRLLAFLHFLTQIGALAPQVEKPIDPPNPALAAARKLLGVDDKATAEDVKRAFRRLARRVHPDMHPAVSSRERHELEDRFSALASAYRALAGSSASA